MSTTQRRVEAGCVRMKRGALGGNGIGNSPYDLIIEHSLQGECRRQPPCECCELSSWRELTCPDVVRSGISCWLDRLC